MDVDDDASISYCAGDDGSLTSYGHYLDICHALNEDVLLRLQRNDPLVVSLKVRAGDWIKGAGRAIGQSKVLKALIADISPARTESLWMTELCQGLSHNQSIEFFKWIICDGDPSVDSFVMVNPFLQNNHIIQDIEITNFFESQSFNSFVSALINCNLSRLKRIYVDWRVHVADYEVATLFDSLRENHTNLIDITFCSHFLERMGSIALSNLLKNPVSKVRSLSLNTIIDTSCLAILSNGLIGSNTLQNLYLENSHYLSSTDCCFLSGVLFHPMCSLKRFFLSECEIGDEGACYLGDALAVNKTLAFFALKFDHSITSAGWKEFAKCLRNPQSTLKELILYGCNMDDEGAVTIATALAGNSSLEILDVDNNTHITSIGLDAFFALLLENRKSKLKELRIIENNIEIQKKTREILLRALCDKTTIESTCSSNHYFCNFEIADWQIWDSVLEEIDDLLDMNRNSIKVDVARRKILKYHFCGGKTGIHALMCMHETVLPYAIEWMGRDERGYLTMFEFVKSFPTLFHVPCEQLYSGKKRKLEQRNFCK